VLARAPVASIRGSLVLLLLLGLKIDVAVAHHSFAAEFDAARMGEISGVVTHVRFSNPHVRYRVDVRASDGAPEEWELQMGSVTALRGRGWGPETLRVGDRITAEGELGRGGTKKLYVRRVETEQGKVVYGERTTGGSRNVVNATPGREYGYGVLNKNVPFDISGAWTNGYKFRVTVDDLEPKPTPFTEEGRKRFEDADHFDDPALRCLAPGLPRIFGSPYNMEIVDAGTHYLVVHVEHNMPRRIYMDGREAPPDWPATSLGYSVGHWDGDALVIETTHLLPGWLDGSGLPMSGEGTRIVERWQFSEDRLTMDRLMTIYDPLYTEPLVRRRGSARGDDVEIIEQGACDSSGYYLDLLESGQLEQRLKR
jgi:hypothetical protein